MSRQSGEGQRFKLAEQLSGDRALQAPFDVAVVLP